MVIVNTFRSTYFGMLIAEGLVFIFVLNLQITLMKNVLLFYHQILPFFIKEQFHLYRSCLFIKKFTPINLALTLSNSYTSVEIGDT